MCELPSLTYLKKLVKDMGLKHFNITYHCILEVYLNRMSWLCLPEIAVLESSILHDYS